MSLRNVKLAQDEVPVRISYLHELERKARAHDSYYRASLAMGAEQAQRIAMMRAAPMATEGTYHLGWIDCLRSFNEKIMDGLNVPSDMHPDAQWPRKVRKGQTCIIDQPGCYCLNMRRSSP